MYGKCLVNEKESYYSCSGSTAPAPPTHPGFLSYSSPLPLSFLFFSSYSLLSFLPLPPPLLLSPFLSVALAAAASGFCRHAANQTPSASLDRPASGHITGVPVPQRPENQDILPRIRRKVASGRGDWDSRGAQCGGRRCSAREDRIGPGPGGIGSGNDRMRCRACAQTHDSDNLCHPSAVGMVAREDSAQH